MSEIHQKLAEEIIRQTGTNSTEISMLFPTIVSMICDEYSEKDAAFLLDCIQHPEQKSPKDLEVFKALIEKYVGEFNVQ